MLPKGHLSHSQVNMMLRCGQQYYHHYVKGLSSPPGWALVRGTALDNAAEADMRQKMVTGRNLSRERYHELLAEVVERSVKEVDPRDEAIVEGGGAEKVVSDFLKTSDRVIDAIKPWADSYEPVAVQKEVRGDVGGYPMLGYIDFRDKGGMITDTKFFTKRKSEGDAETSNQLRLYQILEMKAGEPAKAAELVGIYPVKDAYKQQTLIQLPSPQEDLRYEEVVHNVGRTVEAGIFAPVNLDGPLSWVCSQKWCGFYEMCPYGRAGRKSV